MHEGFPLEVKHACAKVRSVRGLLCPVKAHADFRPIRVAGHCDEEVGLLELGGDGKGVLTGLLHVTGAPDERGGENDALTDGAEVMVSIVDSIGETPVLCCP
jgi:hypothetical protein